MRGVTTTHMEAGEVVAVKLHKRLLGGVGLVAFVDRGQEWGPEAEAWGKKSGVQGRDKEAGRRVTQATGSHSGPPRVHALVLTTPHPGATSNTVAATPGALTSCNGKDWVQAPKHSPADDGMADKPAHAHAHASKQLELHSSQTHEPSFELRRRPTHGSEQWVTHPSNSILPTRGSTGRDARW